MVRLVLLPTRRRFRPAERLRLEMLELMPRLARGPLPRRASRPAQASSSLLLLLLPPLPLAHHLLPVRHLWRERRSPSRSSSSPTTSPARRIDTEARQPVEMWWDKVELADRVGAVPSAAGCRVVASTSSAAGPSSAAYAGWARRVRRCGRRKNRAHRVADRVRRGGCNRRITRHPLVLLLLVVDSLSVGLGLGLGVSSLLLLLRLLLLSLVGGHC